MLKAIVKEDVTMLKAIVKDLRKVLESHRKKLNKLTAKYDTISITYKGDKYYSEDEIMEAYEADIFDSVKCDELITKLETLQKKDYQTDELNIINYYEDSIESYLMEIYELEHEVKC